VLKSRGALVRDAVTVASAEVEPQATLDRLLSSVLGVFVAVAIVGDLAIPFFAPEWTLLCVRQFAIGLVVGGLLGWSAGRRPQAYLRLSVARRFVILSLFGPPILALCVLMTRFAAAAGLVGRSADAGSVAGIAVLLSAGALALVLGYAIARRRNGR
jgi:hypothetical protein